MISVRAVFENGVFRPLQPPALRDGEAVELTVVPAPEPSEDELVARIAACRSIGEWRELTESLPPDDGGDDIVAALDANRRQAGERPLLPDQGAGRE